jgi:hypothetical protein
METPSFETTTQVFVGNHSMNIHIMSRLFQFSKCFQRRRFNLKVQTTDCQVAAIPHMTVTTFIRVVYLICIAQLNDSFQGVGEPPKKGTSRCMTTLNEEYKGRVTYCSHLASVVWTFRLNLLLWKHLANWNQTWHDMNVHWMVSYKNLCCCFKRGLFHIIYLKRVIQLCDTNQVHNSDEGCNGHVRYCCNLASVVLCKLSQLNLSEGMNVHWMVSYKTYVVSKEGVSILYMDFNYVSPSNEGRYILF